MNCTLIDLLKYFNEEDLLLMRFEDPEAAAGTTTAPTAEGEAVAKSSGVSAVGDVNSGVAPTAGATDNMRR